MPTKTDRILSYLPGTFRALLPVSGQLSALYAASDTFGSELQQAENSLAAIMQSHWVDFADRGAEQIDDLARISALYGLSPHSEESVEEFREHLKRYVRTFLEGSVTVQGVLRVTAEALGLHIADSYTDLDTWWKRDYDELVEFTLDGRDAAAHVLGFAAATAIGQPARAAQVVGRPDLSLPVDLRGEDILYLQVDQGATKEIHLVPPDGDAGQVTLEQIVDAINAVFEPGFDRPLASTQSGRLVITSPTTGPSSRLEFEEGPHDAGDRVLGLPPLTFYGQPAREASVTGSVDLAGDLDLRSARFLRLAVDGASAVEIDCGGTTPGHRTAEEVRDAINEALGFETATIVEAEDRKFLRLASPTTGHLSSVAFLQAPGQDASVRLLGPHAPVYLGADEAPAVVFSPEFPGNELNLSLRYNLRLSVDDSIPLTINCAGLRPAETQLQEIANAINAAFGATPGLEIARRVGRQLRLASPTTGEFSQLRFETPDEADATELLFNLPLRTRRGSAPTSARLVGKKEIDEIDLMARHRLQLRVDGRPPVVIDLRRGVERPQAAILQDLVRSIEAQAGDDVATDDGLHLILASPTLGGGSSLEILPLEREARRRFVNRAIITDEATLPVFGFFSARAQGLPATRARLVGKPDLSRGVDLRPGPYLRLSIDGHPFQDIHCAGPRPRATLLEEITAKINTAWNPVVHTEVAFTDGKHLILASPTEGVESSLRFELPRAQDALDSLLGLPPGQSFGVGATGVTLVGLPDLSTGVDLPANAAIRLGLDGASPVEIALTNEGPAHLSLSDLVVAISLALGSGVATHNAGRLIVASPGTGVDSQVELAIPGGTDATTALFGFAAPRKYHGTAALPAVFLGQIDLAGEHDLTTARFLRLGVDGKPPVDIDCAATEPAKTKLDDVVARINAALKEDIASAEGNFLKLQTISAGLSSRLTLEHFTGGDARQTLFGEAPVEIAGFAPTPAVVTGQVPLTSPVDLTQRTVLRIAVDGGRPQDIDIHGQIPATTFLDEIIARINDAFPSLASRDAEDHLLLTSPSAGPLSRVDLLPLRYLELIEYPPVENTPPAFKVRHDQAWSTVNNGAGDVTIEVRLAPASGADGPSIVNETLGWRVRLLETVSPGEIARLWVSPSGILRAEIAPAAGTAHGAPSKPVPAEHILAGPLGAQLPVPFAGGKTSSARLTGSDYLQSLQLNDSRRPGLLVLRARQTGTGRPEISVRVADCDPAQAGNQEAAGGGIRTRLVGRLQTLENEPALAGPGGKPLARLRMGVPVELAHYQDRTVAVTGPLWESETALDEPEDQPPPLMIVEQIDALFDVWLASDNAPGGPVEEEYLAVTIGDTPPSAGSAPYSLAWRVNDGPDPSRLVRAEVLDKATGLSLPRGRSRWRYMECFTDRFDEPQALFDQATFAGGLCEEPGVFDISRFAHVPVSAEMEQAVFAADPADQREVEISLSWTSYQPGEFEVNLPADLPPRFGGRLDLDRFALQSNQPEEYNHVVTEPVSDDDFVVNRIEGTSQLVKATVVPRVPLGWDPIPMPFRKPRRLTLGSEETPARIYLAEEGLDGFIELRAKTEGDWGNAIEVTARKSGPARFDMTLAYQGGRFENGRLVATGPELPDLVLDVLKPALVGALLAKAAGVRVRVTRAGVGDFE